MKNNWKMVGFSILHFLGAIGIPVILALTVGCIKKEEFENEDGPEISFETIENAELNAQEERNFLDVQKDDWVHYEYSVSSFTSPRQPYQAEARSIENRRDLGDNVELVIRQLIYKYNDDGDPVLDSDAASTVLISKITGYSTGPGASATKSNLISSQGFKPAAGNDEYTYHNFSWTQGEIDPPLVVKQKPSCGGVPNCRLRVNTIVYDQIHKTTRQKDRFTLVYSVDTPLNGFLVSMCRRGNVQIGHLTVPGTQCLDLVNFRYGAKSTHTAQEINQRINDALNGKTLYSSQVGETVTVRTGRQRGQESAVIKDYKHEILQRQEGNNEVVLDIHSLVVNSGEAGTTQTCTVHSDGGNDCTAASLPLKSLKVEPNQQVEFKNLTFLSYLTEPPNSIKNMPNCNSLPDCKIHATLLRFQRSELINGSTRNSIHLLEVSPDVPALSAITYGCGRFFEMLGSIPLSTLFCQLLQ